MSHQLLFVYNADSGLWNASLDAIHKILSPKTYPCSLCALTYGAFSMHNEWADFLKNLPVETTFLYKDQWQQTYQLDEPLPAIFIAKEGQITPFISAAELNNFSLKSLQKEIIERLKAFNITLPDSML